MLELELSGPTNISGLAAVVDLLVLADTVSVPEDAETFKKAVDDLLTKRAPMRKAERAAARHGPGFRLVSINISWSKSINHRIYCTMLI